MHNSYAMLGADEGYFETYWNELKAYIQELLGLPVAIQKRRFELAKIAGLAYQKGKTTEMQAAVDSLKRINAMAEPAHTISQKIRAYLPDWLAAEKQSSSQPMSGLGFIPLIAMGVAAAAALAYVAVQGLSLLKEYKSESVIIEDLKAKTLTIEEAKALIRATKPVGAMTAIGESFGGNMGMMVIPALGIGALALAWKFGLLGKRG